MEVLLQTYYTLLPIIATALVGWVGILLKNQKKKDTDREEKQKALSDGITMILRYMLQRYHGEYMIRKKISYGQYQNWKDMIFLLTRPAHLAEIRLRLNGIMILMN